MIYFVFRLYYFWTNQQLMVFCLLSKCYMLILKFLSSNCRPSVRTWYFKTKELYVFLQLEEDKRYGQISYFGRQRVSTSFVRSTLIDKYTATSNITCGCWWYYQFQTRKTTRQVYDVFTRKGYGHKLEPVKQKWAKPHFVTIHTRVLCFVNIALLSTLFS